MPDNIVSFDKARKKQKAPENQELYTLLARIDELEEVLELMSEHGLQTRDDVANLIAKLEQQAAALDPES